MRTSLWLSPIPAFVLGLGSGLAWEAQAAGEADSSFGGPASVHRQLETDRPAKGQPFLWSGLSDELQSLYDARDRLAKTSRLRIGADYSALVQGATESQGDSVAAGGAFRFYGTWNLTGQESGNTGSLTFKVENRHRLGTDVAPQDLALEIGYAGLTAITFSDAGWIATNLYWTQQFTRNRLSFIGGIVDATDYVDVYAFGNPWTDFTNLSFSTNPTIPAPNQGLGVAGRVLLSDNMYILAGAADANGDPSDPWDAFGSAFGDGEFFSHVEIGWVSSFDRRFTDNVHLTAWHADARTNAGIPNGKGIAVSASWQFGDNWVPFLRAGASEGGGALLERSVSAGAGYLTGGSGNLFAVGLNWGRPSESTFGPGLDDQVSAEIFYRMQLVPHITITPALQIMSDPSLAASSGGLAIVGLRVRGSF